MACIPSTVDLSITFRFSAVGEQHNEGDSVCRVFSVLNANNYVSLHYSKCWLSSWVAFCLKPILNNP
jgi:hypothetical protein